MAEQKIKTIIRCQNIAPLDNLWREINSNSLKFCLYANNGCGKTFLSRLFRLTERSNPLELDEEGRSPTDKLITLGKSSSMFSFKIIGKDGEIKEDLKIDLAKGFIPDIPRTQYLYHTFNQDYVEENIRALNYDKDNEIQGFILGKINIDLKDDEEKLEKIEKEGIELSKQLESDIQNYVDENISNIQNIKKLGEFKLLEYQNILKASEKDKYEISKTFEELLESYNKIKSVPENLPNIDSIDRVNIDWGMINDIKQNCLKEYTLSTLADEFKKKIKDKQVFIETGMEILKDSSKNQDCPFCEQNLNDAAIELIENYTTYLNDTEAKTVKLFNNYKEFLCKILLTIDSSDRINNKRINDFNSYKTKYISSCEDIELDILEIKPLKEDIEQLLQLIKEKANNISPSIVVSDDLIAAIEKDQTLLNRIIDLNKFEIEKINSKKNKLGEESKNVRKLICKSAFNYLVEKHKTNISNLTKLRKDYKSLNEEIRRKKEQQKVSKRDRVALTIKTVLKYFFSDKYTLDTESFRLVFRRDVLGKSQACDILSEGEKNIVAFAYYLGDVHLKINNEDDYKKLFFIIDDPISSMDFSHVYTLSGLIREIKNIIENLDKDRMLIFTHNNDFMRILAANNVVEKKLLLKNNEILDFNNNLTVPYISHLFDIYNITRKTSTPNHTTANSIRHIIETLTKFDKVDISMESISEYIRENIPNDTKSYILINDLSHGGWRTEQSPIAEDDYVEVCKILIKHIETEFPGQIDYCKKLCN